MVSILREGEMDRGDPVTIALLLEGDEWPDGNPFRDNNCLLRAEWIPPEGEHKKPNCPQFDEFKRNQ